jgi:toxin ParE1/3/4
MRSVRKQARAETDLIEVWLYTYEQWGEAQADRYLAELEAAIHSLRRHPELGRSSAHIREGYRALSAKRHVVYYTATPSVIQVVRVLHERMDPGRHIGEGTPE